MSQLAIHVDGLAKRYHLGPRQRTQSLREALAATASAPFRRSAAPERHAAEQLWALADVAFDVQHGEVVGIIGRNGAGKSTLLKILSRVTDPTRGAVDVYGRVASLLEVGTGFHSELTGRENIYLNGSLLGMPRAEIRRKFDAIVDFAEVERFLDTPVKRYSSGMYMRLAFAVAAHLEPDILLVDEVLAVGDVEFQKKCLSKMRDVASHGRTVLFVSHNLVAVENLCSRVIQLEAGRLVRDGAPAATIQGYLSEAASAASVADLSTAGGRKGSGEIRFTHAEILDIDGALKPVIRAGDGFTLRLHYRCQAPVTRPVFSLAIVSQHNVPVFAIHTSDLNLTIPRVQHDGYLDLEIARANLMPGSYLVHLAVGDDVDVHRYDHVLDAFEIDLQPADVYGSGKLRAAGWSLVFLPCAWRVPA